MGILNIFTRKPLPQEEIPFPQAVDLSMISQEQLEQDLQKLKEFEEKFPKAKHTEIIPKAKPKPEEEALKLKNPFRGV